MSEKTIEELLTIDPESITTMIDPGVEFAGIIKCPKGKGILISGRFEGSIIGDGNVIINEGGIVKGEIRAAKISLGGTIERLDGKETEIYASEFITIAKTGRLEASSLTYGGLNMEFGAILQANMNPIKDRQSHHALIGGNQHPASGDSHHPAD